MKNLNFTKFLPYVLPSIIFTLFIIVAVLVGKNKLESLPISLSILGAGFAIFQFWIREINIQKSRNYDLKYKAICDFNDNGRELLAILNNYLSQENIDSSNILADVANYGSKLSARTFLSIKILFPNLLDSSEYLLYKNAIDKIVNHASLLKEQEPKIRTKDNATEYKAIVNRWRPDMVRIIEDYYKAETDLFLLFHEQLD